ncbi:hypothetical protein QJS10_CPB19g01157 [Acorus calamus]|uniref:Uncharacterized protein n=1 Tax=Acorus calamus TaxID=4465 RepID=A0AAV9CK62_ACOCL|nr:hypothetical protein QJS10_CPB19g01157 [Acorus calamus]
MGLLQRHMRAQLIVLLLLVSVVRPVPAIRPLGDWWALEQLGGLMLEALPRGHVTPSGPSTCTNVPHRGVSVVRPVPAIRPLEGWWALEQLGGGLMLEALSRGPVTPSGPSTCTNVPNRGGAPCPNN